MEYGKLEEVMDPPHPQEIIFLLCRENSKAWAHGRPGDRVFHFIDLLGPTLVCLSPPV